MKKQGAIIFSVLLVGILAVLTTWWLYILNIIPHRKYSNADFGLTAFVSDKDKDSDGVDDQTDILESAKSYVATEPKYQSRYYAGGYPDDGYGVCTDVVAYALLGAGYDLQELVDADIRASQEQYGIENVDRNIDFRRVDNLNTFFENHAEILTNDINEIAEWQGGDIVVFRDHIGIVSDTRNRHGVPFVIHHANPWQQSYEEDILPYREVIGHYRMGTKKLFAEFYDRAAELLKKMSLEEKVAQLFLVRFPDAEQVDSVLAARPGGFILFAKDFQNETKDSLRQKLQSLQDQSKIKLILGVDEEGGTVTRVSRFPAFRAEKFAAPQVIFNEGGLDAVLDDAQEKSTLLKSLGINMNLAPVADVPTKPTAFMYSRSLGQDAETTAKYVSAVVKAMNDDKIVSVMKHFPGYGDNSDTHTGVAVDQRSYDELAQADLLPFARGIRAGGPTILVSHNIVTAVDDVMPASLSRAVHEILRNELDFTGVIMTDDLAMDAVGKYATNGEAALDAVLAGNDLIITSDFIRQKQEVLSATNQEKVSEARIDESVLRILALKLAYGIME